MTAARNFCVELSDNLRMAEMNPLGIGEYEIIFRDDSGAELGRVPRTASSGRPTRGEHIGVVAGATGLDQVPPGVYSVEEVCHWDTKDTSGRVYNSAFVYARKLEIAPRWAEPPEPTDDERPAPAPPTTSPGRTKSSRARVIPFNPPPQANLPNGSFSLWALAAAVVTVGYAHQWAYFRFAAERAAQIVREGDGWLLTELSPPELRNLAALAKRHQICAERFASQMQDTVAALAAAA